MIAFARPGEVVKDTCVARGENEGMKEPHDLVIVTGSSGYIGSKVVDKFAKRYRLVGLDREVSPHPPPAAECVCVDLTSDASVDAALQRVHTAYGERVASVIH